MINLTMSKPSKLAVFSQHMKSFLGGFWNGLGAHFWPSGGASSRLRDLQVPEFQPLHHRDFGTIEDDWRRVGDLLEQVARDRKI